ncbi:uncharacterized protein V1518DRAFT_434875 [Limtongia smithiae]|uniref:uncharacterized protein n=1 Tax=Limtongia smithiae TaxID=1125753 RepID=UPI0034D002A5
MATTSLKRHMSDMDGGASTSGGGKRHASGSNGGTGVASYSSSSAGGPGGSDVVHLRVLVSSRDAAALIGHKGATIARIRERAGGVRCSFSENVKGAVERVLTVSGSVEAAARAVALLARTMAVAATGEAPAGSDDDDGEAEQDGDDGGGADVDDARSSSSNTSTNVAQPRMTYSVRLLVPHRALGVIIGKQGARVREIAATTGAHVSVSATLLPLSTERSVLLRCHSATPAPLRHAAKLVCAHLAEQADRIAMAHVQYYSPLAVFGAYGRPAHFAAFAPAQRGVRTPANPYGVAATGYSAAEYEADMRGINPLLPVAAAALPSTPTAVIDPSSAGGYDQYQQPLSHQQPQQPVAPRQVIPSVGAPQSVQSAQQAAQAAHPGQPLTQQIYIPNDMVGAIIGKGGSKINEIRQLSGSAIKINEPQDSSNERLVTVTGTPECNQMALYLLYSRLETEKHR